MKDIVAAMSSVPIADRDALYAERDRLEDRRRDLDREHAEFQATFTPGDANDNPAPQPVTADDRSHNPLRPTSLEEVIGQDRAKKMLRRVIDTSKRNGESMDHILLVGPAGTGKTTFANVIAEERGVDCYQVAAPVSLDTLIDLRSAMNPSDIFFIDEIHMQAIQERRGKESITQPEVFLQLLEDSVIATPAGMLDFPDVTVIGATTDPGRLPDPFLDRFPLQPRLEKYDPIQLALMAIWNAEKLNLKITQEAALAFANAARGTPRIVNNYVRNARAIAEDGRVTEAVAEEVLLDLNDVTLDGLTRDQQEMLMFLFEKGRREKADGEVVYQASVSSIATGIGLSRDQKAVQLRVEPHLIQEGYVQVGHGGRLLTDAGVTRAIQLSTEV